MQHSLKVLDSILRYKLSYHDEFDYLIQKSSVFTEFCEFHITGTIFDAS